MAIAERFLTPEYIEIVKQKILTKVHVTKDGCWVWQGTKESVNKPVHQRYGKLNFAGKKRLAHRVSKALFHGFHNLLNDRHILCCHKCDNPLCVNPEHIFLGTHYDNNKDKQNKGRAKKYRLTCPHCDKEF